MTELYPLRLAPSFRERIWGSHDLAPIFRKQDRKIGEAWYSFDDNTIANGPLAGTTLRELIETYGAALMGENWGLSQAPSSKPEHQGEPQKARSGLSPFFRPPSIPTFPILAKLLFTSDRLSVQVHPNDDYAREHEDSAGKTEMWYVLAAQPGASVALGLTRVLSKEDLREAAISGEIEHYLNWVEVEAGEAFFIPAGTLHAIGSGLVLCEIQQNSDATYRFYDFGRLGTDGEPRELHIEKAVAVTELQPHPGAIEPFRFPNQDWTRQLLVASPHFAVEHWAWDQPITRPNTSNQADLLVFLQGEGAIAGHPYTPGDTYLLPAELSNLKLIPTSSTHAIRTYLPVHTDAERRM